MSVGLHTRPSATTFDVEDLVTEAWRGHIRVPHFQRDFRWGQEDVIRLFDSIVRGYPVGSLLLWVRTAPEERITLGDLEIPAPATSRALYVVDGQQRVVSLANALSASGNSTGRFALAYDLRRQKFVPRSGIEDPWVIPLPVLFDLQRLISWFAEREEIKDELNNATGVTKTIRQFEVPAYLVEQGDAEILQDIFDRMNNYGKRLRRAEIFSALFPREETATDSVLDIDRMSSHIDVERGFGVVDDDTILLAILARRSPNISREIRTEFNDLDRRVPVEFPDEKRDAAYEAAEQALIRAVTFLQEVAGVPHVSFLPYRYLLVVLSRLFAHHPNPDHRNLQLLRRWYWRAAVAGPEAFKGNVTGALRILCSRISADSLSGSVQGLLHEIGEKPRPLPTLKRFKTNEAATKIVLACWWSLGPRSLVDGQPFDRGQLSEFLGERATAAEAVRYVVSRRAIPAGNGMWAAARIFLPTEDEPVSEISATLARRPLHVDAETWRQMLRSHTMTDEIVDRLAEGDVTRFLSTRQELLEDHLRRFLEQMCEWGFEDTPPLEEFVAEDDDSDVA